MIYDILILFSPLENNIHILAPPCNILYIYMIYLLSCIFFLSHLSYENQLLHGVDENSENNWYRKVIGMEKYKYVYVEIRKAATKLRRRCSALQ